MSSTIHHTVKKSLQRISRILTNEVLENLNASSWTNIYEKISNACNGIRCILAIESNVQTLDMFIRKINHTKLKNSRWDALSYVLGKLTTITAICSNGKFEEAKHMIYKINHIINLLQEDQFDAIEFKKIVENDYVDTYVSYPIGYNNMNNSVNEEEKILDGLVILSGGINNYSPFFAFSSEKSGFYAVMLITGILYIPDTVEELKKCNVEKATTLSIVNGIYAQEWLYNQLKFLESSDVDDDRKEIPKILSILEQFHNFSS